MKPYYFFFVFFISFFSYAQSKFTVEQVEKSTDPKVIANFIKYNPDHPKTPEFKRKLLATINNDKSPAEQKKFAEPTVKPINTNKLKNEVAKTGVSAQGKKTEDLLNHIFSSDSTNKDAYVQIVNKSKCNLIVKISGNKFYNLDVPANNQNFILVEKGNYTLTTLVCDAQYSSTKSINKNMVITLNPPK